MTLLASKTTFAAAVALTASVGLALPASAAGDHMSRHSGLHHGMASDHVSMHRMGMHRSARYAPAHGRYGHGRYAYRNTHRGPYAGGYGYGEPGYGVATGRSAYVGPNGAPAYAAPGVYGGPFSNGGLLGTGLLNGDGVLGTGVLSGRGALGLGVLGF